MSAPLDDLMGNSLTEPISDMSEDSPDVEVSVVDDRPEEDQVAPRDDERAKGFDPDEEIADIGGRAGKRIKQLRYEYHEQRRNKEAAERMREEAVGYAQNMAHQNAQLRELLERGEKVLLSEIKARTEADLRKARDGYKSAYEEGDSDAILKAQEELNRSQIDRRAADGYQPLAAEPAVGAWQVRYAPHAVLSFWLIDVLKAAAATTQHPSCGAAAMPRAGRRRAGFVWQLLPNMGAPS